MIVAKGTVLNKPAPQKDNTWSPELQSKAMDLNAGWFGVVFGAGSNAFSNILCLLLLLFSISLVFAFCVKPIADAEKLSTIVVPIITTLVGYFAGKHGNIEK